jgi:hypothetical protein
MAMAIDTLAYARRLREAGLSEQQAEGHAEALAAAMTDTLATKQDLRELALATQHDLREHSLSMKQELRELSVSLRQDLRELEARTEARFAQIDSRFAQVDDRFVGLEKRTDERLSSRLNEQTAFLRAEMADLERRMTMRLGGITVAGIGVVSALVKVL